MLPSDLRFLTSDLVCSFAKVFVIDYIIAGKDSFTRHPKLNEILDVSPTAHQSGGKKGDDPPLDHFLPLCARFILSGTLGHDNHWDPATQTTVHGDQ